MFGIKSLFSSRILEKFDRACRVVKSLLMSKLAGHKGETLNDGSFKGEAALFARTNVSFTVNEAQDADFKVALFRASQTQYDLPYHDIEKSYGWGEYLGDRLCIEEVAGDHLSLIQPPNVSELAKKANRYLS